MKFIFLIFMFTASFIYAQQNEYQFSLNVKKFKSEFLKVRSKAQKIVLYSVQGHPINFSVYEYSIYTNPIPNVYTFKGKSMDDSKLVYFTLLGHTITGAFSQNGI